MKNLSLILCSTLLFGCAPIYKPAIFTPPATYNDFSIHNKLINATFDQTWSAVLRVISNENLLIKTIDKASGIITADMESWNKHNFSVLMDCGNYEFNYTDDDYFSNFGTMSVKIVNPKININFFLQPASQNETIININVKGVAWWNVITKDKKTGAEAPLWSDAASSLGVPTNQIDCVTNGIVENLLLSEIKAISETP